MEHTYIGDAARKENIHRENAQHCKHRDKHGHQCVNGIFSRVKHETYTTVQKFEVSKIFKLCFWKKSLMLDLFDQIYSKDSDIVKYYYNV